MDFEVLGFIAGAIIVGGFVYYFIIKPKREKKAREGLRRPVDDRRPR